VSEAELVHGTAVSLGVKAVLIRGPSGSGKSDLALRCIAAAPLPQSPLRAELVADDQVRLVRQGGFIAVSAPTAIAGKMEVRGLGILAVPYRLSARLALIVDIVPAADVPRFPLEDTHASFAGVEIPILHLAAFESSAPVKLLLSLHRAL